MRLSLPLAVLLSVLLAVPALADPVDFKELIPLVSLSIPGWTAETPRGQTMRQPLEASEATLEFAKGELRLEVAIYDGGAAMGAAMGAAGQVEMETTEESVKPVSAKGFKGSLFRRFKDKEADLVLMVPPRFAVSLHLTGSSDGELLLGVASQMDLARLSALGK